ncbi:MAG: hypothetical protein KGM16_13645 [Bacteroidota bacterium]|nr:hypothetical protein [Bacteroidota bacterium]
MNIEKVLSIAERTFGDIHSVKDNLYRGEIKINDKSAGSYFLDFNQDISLNNFREYQENLLADEYYNLPSKLQRNFYLFLVRDNIDSNFKSVIEKNDLYARKYVFNEAEFEDYFKIETSNVANYDIISELIKKLDEAELYEVYGKVTLSGTLENFVRNKSLKLGRVVESNTLNLDPKKINLINKLKLCANYRQHPISPRVFEFGKVNLFKGINGVGKTSILEAIELIICGRTLRNPGYQEKNSCIEVLFNDSIIENKFTSDNKLYQARDAEWYSRSYSRDNYLYQSFNRYNFFNSDAAYTFSNSSDEKTIKKALNDIVFGAEYNYIVERIRKLYPDFRKEFNRLISGINDASSNIKEAEKVVKEKSNESSTLSLEKAIDDNCKTLKFIHKSFEVANDYTLIEQFNNELKTLVDKVFENPFGSISNLKDVDEYLAQANNIEDLLKKASIEIRELNKTLDNSEILLRELYAEEALLIQADKFFVDRNLFSIEGLQKKVNTINDIIIKQEHLETSLKGIDFNMFHSNETASYLKEINEIAIQNLKKELFEFEAESRRIIERLGEVERIIKEIKLLGKDYLQNNEKATNCPLCDTQFSVEELKARIESISDSEADVEDLIKLRDNENRVKIQILEINKFLDDLDKINVAYNLVAFAKNGDYNLTEMIGFISSFLMNTRDHISQKRELENLQKLISSFNITESEFEYLKSKLNEIFHGELIFEFASKQKFDDRRSRTKTSIETQRKNISDLQTKKEKLILELKLKLQLNDPNINSFEDITDKIQNDLLEIKKLKDYFEKIFVIIELNRELRVDDIDITSKNLSKNINSYKLQLQSQSELELAKKQITLNQDFISKNKVLAKRLEKACSTLKDLNEGDDQNIENFFKQNIEEVFDIFKSIHSPNEFKNVEFNRDTLNLITQKGEVRLLSQISAGQRSAVALSLFITLNRKLKKGPNLIMFDDPVSFVDDLNILSFLDYLRFFVLKENKQIFFATANVRLAILFEKKFEFLGNDDFKAWELKRSAI